MSVQKPQNLSTVRICVNCGHPVERLLEGTAANDNNGVIRVATELELLSHASFQRLAEYVSSVDVPSRRFLDYMADRLFPYEGIFLNSNGTAFVVGDETIDDAFNNEASCRWIRAFKNSVGKVMLQTPQRRLLDRLRLIDLTRKVDDALVMARIRCT